MKTCRSLPFALLCLSIGCGGTLVTTGSTDGGGEGGSGDGGTGGGGTTSGGTTSGGGDDGGVHLGPAVDGGCSPVAPLSGLPAHVIDGGQLASLDFGVVGDTRPVIYDDTPNYPTQVITTIFQDLDALSPPVAFVAATGDYMFADPLLGLEQTPQAKLFVGAAKKFTVGQVYTAMGNHECDWATSNDNCTGNDSNPNYQSFLHDILGGLGLPNATPYFAVTYSSSDCTRPWTAKMIYMAANSWDGSQNSWLTQILAVPTTYTFLFRHEPSSDSGGAPGVAPSDSLLQTYPFTLKLTGHSHSYSYDPKNREVVNGLAGAPLNAGYSGTFGYVVCRQRSDGAVQCSLYDYESNALSSQPSATIAVSPDGSAVQPQ